MKALANLNPNTVPMNFYLKIGGFTGVLTDFLLNSWENILLTFVLGFVGALGGALAKKLVDRLNN